jgi:hypothetical protein
MSDKPNPNPDEPKREIPPAPPSVGGDYIVVQGDVGTGAVIGGGSLTADYIARGDIVINNGIVAEDPAQFVELLNSLKQLLQEAEDKGEFAPPLAKQAIQNVSTAAAMVEKDKKPPKPELLKRLESVVQLIGTGLDTITADGSVGSLLLKALPIAVALVKLASHLF